MNVYFLKLIWYFSLCPLYRLESEAKRKPSIFIIDVNIFILNLYSDQNDPDESVELMREYIEDVERRAAEKQEKENEEKRKQINHLIELYSRKSLQQQQQQTDKNEESREKIIQELISQYGQKRERRQCDMLSVEARAEMKTTPRKISVSPRIFESEISVENNDLNSLSYTNQTSEEEIDIEEKPRSPLRRPRPTYLQLNISYEAENNDAFTI